MKSKNAFFVLLLFPLMLNGQSTPVANPNAVASVPPVVPFLFETRYWDQQFTQWVDKDLPYVMVEAYSQQKKGVGPLDVVLLDRGTYKRTHYVNSPEVARSLDLLGESAQLAKVTMKNVSDQADSPTFEFTVQPANGPGILWRYIQGSEITDMGSGLTPHPSASAVVFMYREAGAVAGQGTALQVGDAVSEANLWSEISHPPYFIAYHGANTVGLDMLALRKGACNLSLKSAPAHMAAGEEWSLEDASLKLEVRIQIVKVNGDIFELSQSSDADSEEIEMTAKRSEGGWLIESVRYRPKQGGMTMNFTPGMPVAGAIGPQTVAFDMQAGKARHVVSGAVAIVTNTEGTSYRWTFKSPEWAGREIATYTVKTDPKLVSIKGDIAIEKHAK